MHATRTPLATYLKHRQALIHRALDTVLPPAGEAPSVIHEAMRYSVLGDGKRIRPILTLAAAEAVGGALEEAMPAACAVELVHAYSLIHDDLPAMDDDDLRRGRPSCHKQFGEAIGILAGDALLTLSFAILSARRRRPAVWIAVARELARGAGTFGMVGGQVMDIQGVGRTPDRQAMDYILTHKTGALITAAVRMGGLAGGASRAALAKLTRYGECVGLVFQLVDDLLDRDGVVPVWGEAPTRRKAQTLTGEATQAVASLGRRAEPLARLAEFLLTRAA
ncbi:MAG: polyprenyl synthetase family protein [Candidatus Omnitrophica bacterium]|nr:polyprenyl synthetase family protein [Candidatus Omnitrophota bacterium]